MISTVVLAHSGLVQYRASCPYSLNRECVLTFDALEVLVGGATQTLSFGAVAGADALGV